MITRQPLDADSTVDRCDCKATNRPKRHSSAAAVGYTLILIGGGISTVAAIISVKGMGVVFSGAAITVMVLMGSLELGKLAAATSVHLYSDTLNPLTRRYLTAMAVILCAITSLGVYSLLTNAWATTQSTGHQWAIEQSFIEARIDRVTSRRSHVTDQLDQLDASIAVFLQFERATQAEVARQNQQDQRRILNTELATLNRDLDQLHQQRIEISQQQSALSAKNGVINHVAALVNVNTDTAATVFALLIVSAADPLAVLLLVTGLGLVSQHQSQLRSAASHQKASKDIDSAGESPANDHPIAGDDTDATAIAASCTNVSSPPAAPPDDLPLLPALRERVLTALVDHHNTLTNGEGDRFLRAPTSTIRALLMEIDPTHLGAVSELITAIDLEGLPARQMRIGAERIRAIKLPNHP